MTKIKESSTVTLSILFIIIGSVGGGAFWLSSLFSSVSKAEMAINEIRADQESKAETLTDLKIEVAKLNLRMDTIATNEDIKDLKKILKDIRQKQEAGN